MRHETTNLGPEFPLLPIRGGVLFPAASLTLPVGRPRSLALLANAKPGEIIGIISIRDVDAEGQQVSDFHGTGTFARIIEIKHSGPSHLRLTVEGLERFQLAEVDNNGAFLKGRANSNRQAPKASVEAELLAQALQSAVRKQLGEGAVGELLSPSDTPGLLADKIGAALQLPVEKSQGLLDEWDIAARLRSVTSHLADAKTLGEIRGKIEAEVREEFNRNRREAVLREQLKAIQKELGEGPGADDEDWEARIEAAQMPPKAEKAARQALSRLTKGGQGSPDANVQRTYLEWLCSLPWSKRADEELDLNDVSARLEASHAGLEKVKERVLQHMAVRKLSKDETGSILCLVGPPGVGKTSLATAIADALERPFVRVALGGVRDEAEIRGHRRTYVGAIPGRVIAGLKEAGVKNPVVLLDEIDKLGKGWGGSPEAALLEVLDPEQNKHFTDHYLDTPFDLSECFFLCTANQLDSLSGPLRDRLEIIELTGYSPLEKQAIAETHVVPARLKKVGLSAEEVRFEPAAIKALIENYTREAGIRQLTRLVDKVLRHVALLKAKGDLGTGFVVTEAGLEEVLGNRQFRSAKAEKHLQPGIATGLAWTPVGGDILYIETSRAPGSGKLQITGKLGDVMKESAQAALSYVRAQPDLEVDAAKLNKFDLHIHVPAGAVPKDGPSAGVTMFTALTSLLSGRPVRSDTAMTGECSLRGRVLPVGGIVAKVMAAHRAGIRRVLLPLENKSDFAEVPESVRAELEAHFVGHMNEVLPLALSESSQETSLDLGPQSVPSHGHGANRTDPHAALPPTAPTP